MKDEPERLQKSGRLRLQKSNWARTTIVRTGRHIITLKDWRGFLEAAVIWTRSERKKEKEEGLGDEAGLKVR